jgi:DNA polymerase alpha subunit A
VPVDGNIDEKTLNPVQFTVIRQLNDIPFPAGFQDMVKRQGSRVEFVRNERALLNFLIGI